MLLKRLELNGFKSFAGRTVLEFPGGVTSVVGPNGSGKSNIIDAIRWLLGEREAKHLRGGSIKDLIFSGGSGRGRAGVASVTLIFDNSSKFFPLEFDEVEVRREVDRTGSSAYFVNKSEARLREVVEFLSQSRLGTKGIVVVTQGNSDLFIKASPAERREMVEEILGLREFRLKKSEAERRLKNTYLNLEKVKVLIEELLPHLRMLKRQAAKWEKRAEVEKELKQAEDIYFSVKADQFERKCLELDPEMDSLKKKYGVAERELRDLEEKLEKIEGSEPEDRRRLALIRKQKEEVLKNKEEAERELVKAEVKMEVAEKQKETEEIDIARMVPLFKEVYKEAIGIIKDGFDKKRAQELLLKITERGKEILAGGGRRGEDLGELKESWEKAGRVRRELTARVGELEREEAALEKKLYKFTEEFKGAFALVEKKKVEMSRIKEEGRELEMAKEKWNLKINELKEQVRQAGRKFEDFSGRRVRQVSEAEMAEAEKKIFRLRGVLAAMGEVDKALVKEASETEERYEFLKGQMTDLEQAAADLEEAIGGLARKIHEEFNEALKKISGEFEKLFKMIFGGGRARLLLESLRGEESSERTEDEKGELGEVEKETRKAAGKYKDLEAGVGIELSLPNKKVSGLDVLSGGERSLVSIAALFALVSVSPPPFLVLDEIDAPLDENNAGKFAKMIKEFSKRVQFIVVTHNRATMEAADILYGVTMGEDGASKLVSLKMVD